MRVEAMNSRIEITESSILVRAKEEVVLIKSRTGGK
jgi:hypothetical protein